MTVYLDREGKPREFVNFCCDCQHQEDYKCHAFNKIRKCDKQRALYGWTDCELFQPMDRMANARGKALRTLWAKREVR